MSNYATAAFVLEQVEKYIKECESTKLVYRPSYRVQSRSVYKRFKIREVCDDLSIFDWWGDYLSCSQLKSMRSFLKTAIKLGFTGYVCFRVGSVGCSHGMWAHKQESTDGNSPDGDVLFHSFRCDMNDWDVQIGDHPYMCDIDNKGHTLAEVKDVIANPDAYWKRKTESMHQTLTEVGSMMKDLLKDIHQVVEDIKAKEGS